MAIEKETKFGTSLIAVATLIVAAIAVVPAFLSLNEKQANIFYSASISSVNIPEYLNKGSILKLLHTNGVPGSTLELDIINQGNSSAGEIKLSVTLPTDAIAAWSVPSKSDNPVWVDLPEIKTLKNKNEFRFSLKNVAATLPISLYFGYKQEVGSLPQVQVFYDGVPAIVVDNVREVSAWSKWNVFKLPMYILLGGIGLILAWAFVVALYSNPELRYRVLDELIDAFSVGISPSKFRKTIESFERSVEKGHNKGSSNCRERIDEIDSPFNDVFDWVDSTGGLNNLVSAGGVEFYVSAEMTGDGRRFLSLPHSNRVYEGDWGFRNNSMGKDGQRIGQYCLPLHQKYMQRNA
ncbi:MAG: hypothetical protein ACI93R_004111 [Flavobacteriales bacterium]|jgi:hypothetical protein